MLKNLGKISGVICLMLIHFTGVSQDFHFTQAGYAPLSVNPALAGADHSQQAGVVYKDQWRKIGSPYKTLYAGYDMRIREKKSWTGFFAAGISAFSDKAGDAKMGLSQIGASFAYHVIISSRITLGAAIQPGFAQRSVSLNDLKWGSQFDGRSFNNTKVSGENNLNGNISYFDVNSGIVFSYKRGERRITANNHFNISAGFAVYHLAQPKYSYYSTPGDRLFRKYSFFSQGLIGINNTKQSVMPAIYYTTQGKQKEILFGSYFRYKVKEKSSRIDEIKGQAVAIGLFYRSRDAVAFKLLYQMAGYDIGLSYDFNTSPLRKVSGYNGGAELMIRWVTPDPFTRNVIRF